MFDQKVPKQLRLTQEWFGGIISQPLENDAILPISPNGRSIIEEAREKILPSPTLQPHERLQIYNQQYWWRLLKVLQDSYPLLTRIFGREDFNSTIAQAFLLHHPPDHWSINELGIRLPEWITKAYQKKDAPLVHSAAQLDLSFLSLFYVSLQAPLTPDQMEQKLTLQSHVRLFAYPFDLFTFRHELLMQNIDYWIENPFPELKKGSYFTILFRTPKGHTAWKAVQEAEYCLLNYFQKGATLDEACSWLEKQPETLRKQAEEHLEKWFHEWSSKGLLTHAEN